MSSVTAPVSWILHETNLCLIVWNALILFYEPLNKSLIKIMRNP